MKMPMNFKYCSGRLLLAAALCLPSGSVALAEGWNSKPVPVTQGYGSLDMLGGGVYQAAETLSAQSPELGKDRPIIVTTMVSIDDLNQSSTFGRLTSQMIANRLTQLGYLVKDITYTRGLELKPGTGEIALSRDVSKVGNLTNAQSVVVGTYAIGGTLIYLNIRMLKADTGQVLSSFDLTFPLDVNLTTLVNQRPDNIVMK